MALERRIYHISTVCVFFLFFLVGYYSGDTNQAVKAQQSQQEIGHSQKN